MIAKNLAVAAAAAAADADAGFEQSSAQFGSSWQANKNGPCDLHNHKSSKLALIHAASTTDNKNAQFNLEMNFNSFQSWWAKTKRNSFICKLHLPFTARLLQNTAIEFHLYKTVYTFLYRFIGWKIVQQKLQQNCVRWQPMRQSLA